MSKYFLIAALLVVGVFAGSASTAQAQVSNLTAPVELEGWAWSSTIGWISMNCVTAPAGCGVDYKVIVNPGGDVTGYAWSENIGWIKFDDLSGFLSGAGTSANDAQANGVFPNLTITGWARACSGTVHSADPAAGPYTRVGDCSTMISRNDGWDGWISLGGTGYSIVTDAGGVVGLGTDGRTDHWAWGSVVVGWVDFGPVEFGSTPTPPPSTPPVLSLTANPTTVSLGDSTTLEYDVTGADSCTASGATGWTGDKDYADSGATAHSEDVTPLTSGVTTYTLRCSNAAGEVTDAVDVTATTAVPPTPPTAPSTLQISSDPPFIRAGQTSTITWEVVAVDTVTCSVIGQFDANIADFTVAAGDTYSASETSAALFNAAVFTIECDAGDPASSQVEVIPTFQEI